MRMRLICFYFCLDDFDVSKRRGHSVLAVALLHWCLSMECVNIYMCVGGVASVCNIYIYYLD